MSGNKLLQRAAVKLAAGGPQIRGEALGFFEDIVGD